MKKIDCGYGRTKDIFDIVLKGCSSGDPEELFGNSRIEKRKIVMVMSNLIDCLAKKGILSASDVMEVCDGYPDSSAAFVEENEKESEE